MKYYSEKLNKFYDTADACEKAEFEAKEKENLEKIKELTSGKADTRLMPSLNHLFQHCTTGSPEEYLSIEETISPEVLEILADWILEK